jgi:hypothetical protein
MERIGQIALMVKSIMKNGQPSSSRHISWTGGMAGCCIWHINYLCVLMKRANEKQLPIWKHLLQMGSN